MGKGFLITGWEGFIGRNLRSPLEDKCHGLETLDIIGNPDYSISVADTNRIMGINSGFDLVFPLAAVTSPPVVRGMLYGFKVNKAGTLNVSEMTRRKSTPFCNSIFV